MKIKVYGTDWCSDCILVKNFLSENGIKFEYINIADNRQAIRYVEKINNGKRIIPTLEINGKTYTNPQIQTLQKIIEL